MKRRKKKPDEGARWMDTYGDMVTLLLCFFVLMYAISSVDQAKWKAVVKSFNPDGDKLSQIVEDPEADGEDFVPGGTVAKETKPNAAETEETFNDLYEKLKKAVEESGHEDDILLYKGDNYTFIRFNNHVFFDGDSSVIKKDGYDVLDKFIEALSGNEANIQELQVLGHTSQADAKHQNETSTDRVLSANRSANVAAYIQDRISLEPSKIVSMGYGQFRPIAPFDTAENRSKNRRVEIVITKVGAKQMSLEEYYEQINQ